MGFCQEIARFYLEEISLAIRISRIRTPRAEWVLDDQIAAYDEMRGHCPVDEPWVMPLRTT